MRARRQIQMPWAGSGLVVHEIEVLPHLLDLTRGADRVVVGEFAENGLDCGDYAGEGWSGMGGLDGGEDEVVGVPGEGGGAKVGENADGGAAVAGEPGQATQGSGQTPDVDGDEAVALFEASDVDCLRGGEPRASRMSCPAMAPG